MLDEGTQRDEHSSLAKEFTTSRMRETVAWCRELFGGPKASRDRIEARHDRVDPCAAPVLGSFRGPSSASRQR